MELTIELPPWAAQMVQAATAPVPAAEDRMRFAVELARQNVARGTGGPFGAAVFDGEGRIVAAGVNQVAAGRCSILHAEIVAIALAQKAIGRYDLGDGGRLEFELVTSCEPCAMCLGAVHWSGASRLTCGAREEDAQAAGFDEGPKPHDWPGELEHRGIRVRRDVLRSEAAEVLKLYARQGGVAYNPGRPG